MQAFSGERWASHPLLIYIVAVTFGSVYDSHDPLESGVFSCVLARLRPQIDGPNAYELHSRLPLHSPLVQGESLLMVCPLCRALTQAPFGCEVPAVLGL